MCTFVFRDIVNQINIPITQSVPGLTLLHFSHTKDILNRSSFLHTNLKRKSHLLWFGAVTGCALVNAVYTAHGIQHQSLKCFRETD